MDCAFAFYCAGHPAQYIQAPLLCHPNNSAKGLLLPVFYKEATTVREIEWGTCGHTTGSHGVRIPTRLSQSQDWALLFMVLVRASSPVLQGQRFYFLSCIITD